MNGLSQKKKGMTLLEAIIAIAIFVIGVEGFSLLFARSWQANHFIFESGQASLLASQATTEVVNDLRKAKLSDTGEYSVKSGSDFDLVVYTDVDSDGTTERVHYFLDGHNLKKGISKPSGNPLSYPSGDDSVKILSGYIINNSSQPVFYYYNKDYPGDTVHNPLAIPVSVSDVKMIKIHLMINIDPGKAPENINIESFAQLRNVQ